MIINMTGGGGGAALNFKVVPGLTHPGTASGNTIWVKTEKIGVWYFSATQPEGLQEWDVWFLTGTESNFAFNALRKNAVQVYPLSAKQYVSNEWKEIPAFIYQGEEWKEWKVSILTLFKEFTKASENSANSSITVKNGVINFDTHSQDANNQGNVTYYSDVKVDVSKYKTLTFEATVSGEPFFAKVGFYTNNTTKFPWEAHGIGGVNLENGTKTYTVDISAIGNDTYFGVGAAGGAAVKTINVEVRDLYLT